MVLASHTKRRTDVLGTCPELRSGRDRVRIWTRAVCTPPPLRWLQWWDRFPWGCHARLAADSGYQLACPSSCKRVFCGHPSTCSPALYSGTFFFFLLLLFLAAWGLCCCPWTFCKQGLLFIGLHRLLSLRTTGSVVVAHRLSGSEASGILPDQRWNPCPLHWQVDSSPLGHHREVPGLHYLTKSLWWLPSACSQKQVP